MNTANKKTADYKGWEFDFLTVFFSSLFVCPPWSLFQQGCSAEMTFEHKSSRHEPLHPQPQRRAHNLSTSTHKSLLCSETQTAAVCKSKGLKVPISYSYEYSLAASKIIHFILWECFDTYCQVFMLSYCQAKKQRRCLQWCLWRSPGPYLSHISRPPPSPASWPQ